METPMSEPAAHISSYRQQLMAGADRDLTDRRRRKRRIRIGAVATGAVVLAAGSANAAGLIHLDRGTQPSIDHVAGQFKTAFAQVQHPDRYPEIAALSNSRIARTLHFTDPSTGSRVQLAVNRAGVVFVSATGPNSAGVAGRLHLSPKPILRELDRHHITWQSIVAAAVPPTSP